MQKRSRQRDLLLEILRSTTCHPDADWVFARMREQMPNVSLGTVYRNLSRLAEEGIILKLDVGQNADRFDGCINPHYHLACKGCGAVVDMPMAYTPNLNAAAEAESGCEIEGHALLFYGKCPSCAGSL
ncbi:MAG: transcriptional repressor [Clostridia bacterium]|nr:transcriptional repressor [Oscillospiraceae bacterium]MBQ7033454.1 transcriptional repressor [Clostridia bacterium]